MIYIYENKQIKQVLFVESEQPWAKLYALLAATGIPFDSGRLIGAAKEIAWHAGTRPARLGTYVTPLYFFETPSAEPHLPPPPNPPLHDATARLQEEIAASHAALQEAWSLAKYREPVWSPNALRANPRENLFQLLTPGLVDEILTDFKERPPCGGVRGEECRAWWLACFETECRERRLLPQHSGVDEKEVT